MFCSILHFLRSRKKSNIIGHYRRNILSLKETVFYAIFILVLLLLHSTVMKFHHFFGFSAYGLRLFSFIHTLLVHQLCEGIRAKGLDSGGVPRVSTCSRSEPGLARQRRMLPGDCLDWGCHQIVQACSCWILAVAGAKLLYQWSPGCCTCCRN